MSDKTTEYPPRLGPGNTRVTDQHGRIWCEAAGSMTGVTHFGLCSSCGNIDYGIAIDSGDEHHCCYIVRWEDFEAVYLAAKKYRENNAEALSSPPAWRGQSTKARKA